MSGIKKWIILLGVLLIITVIALIVIITASKEQNQGELFQPKIEEEEDIPLDEPEEELQLVKNRMDFYIVKECVNKFYSYYAITFNVEEYYGTTEQQEVQEGERLNSNILYNMMDQEYITEKGITSDNIKTKLSNMETVIVDITNMYVSEKTSNINVYLVQGSLREMATSNIKQFQLIVKIDTLNKTFSIVPQEFIEENSDLIQGNGINIDVPENIKQNENNTYNYKSITDETYAKDLFSQFKNQILYNEKQVYDNLDEEYRNKRFSTLDKFQKYIQDNKQKFSTMQIQQYQRSLTDNYTQYVCVDQNGNNYIFRENAIMNYSLILDTYTIDLPEYIEKYSESSNDEKTLLNIQKIFDAINSKDYSYVYSKLDETFKQNNFGSQEGFERYIKENLFEQNQFSYANYQESGSLQIYDITITDKTGSNKKSIKKTIIMQLKEGTDFVMSFNIQ